MKRLSSKELGHYLPSFFFLKINTEEDLSDLNTISDKSRAVFIHEYIHFLQNILTTYGLRHTTFIVDKLKLANRTIYFSPETTFNIPYRLPKNPTHELNTDLVSVYQGDDNLDFSFDEILSIDLKPNELISGFEHVPYLSVKVKNNFLKTEKEIHVGATCIYEGMAYLIEAEYFGQSNPRQVPYRMSELICKFLYPEICNTENIVAMSDVALSTFNPGHSYYLIITELKKHGVIPKSSTEVFHFASNIKNWGSKDYGLAAVFRENSLLAEKSLSDFFTSNSFDPAKNWAKITLSLARDIRIKEKFSFADLVNNKKNGLKIIREFTERIGTPLIANNLDIHWVYHPNTNSENQAAYFKAINEIYGVLFGNKRNCELKKHCKQNPNGDLTCSFCDTEPWRRVEYEQPCPFSIIWEMWGLHKKRPITSVSSSLAPKL